MNMKQETKDKLKVAVAICGFIAVIGLLMAWNDGYLEGTVLADVLSVLFPALLISYTILIATTYWLDKAGTELSGKATAILFVASVISVILIELFVPSSIQLVLLLILGAIVVLSLIVVWLSNLK